MPVTLLYGPTEEVQPPSQNFLVSFLLLVALSTTIQAFTPLSSTSTRSFGVISTGRGFQTTPTSPLLQPEHVSLTTSTALQAGKNTMDKKRTPPALQAPQVFFGLVTLFVAIDYVFLHIVFNK
jgi:hypothetical protein